MLRLFNFTLQGVYIALFLCSILLTACHNSTSVSPPSSAIQRDMDSNHRDMDFEEKESKESDVKPTKISKEREKEIQNLFKQKYIDPLSRYIDKYDEDDSMVPYVQRAKVEREKRCAKIEQKFKKKPKNNTILSKLERDYNYSCPNFVANFAREVAERERATSTSEQVSTVPVVAEQEKANNEKNSEGYYVWDASKRTYSFLTQEEYTKLEGRHANVDVVPQAEIGAQLTNDNDYRASGDFFEQHLVRMREKGNKADIASTLSMLGSLYSERGLYSDIQRSETSFQEALTIYRDLAKTNPRTYLYYVAMCANNLGRLYFDQDKINQALPYYEEAVAIHRQLWQADLYNADDLIWSLIGNAFAQQDTGKRCALITEAIKVASRGKRKNEIVELTHKKFGGICKL